MDWIRIIYDFWADMPIAFITLFILTTRAVYTLLPESTERKVSRMEERIHVYGELICRQGKELEDALKEITILHDSLREFTATHAEIKAELDQMQTKAKKLAGRLGKHSMHAYKMDRMSQFYDLLDRDGFWDQMNTDGNTTEIS